MKLTAAVVAMGLTAASPAAFGQCGSGPACPPCRSCRVGPASGTNPSVTEMSSLFDRIAAGPTHYGSLGWDFGGRNTIGAGPGWCSGSGRRDTVAVSFPCILLKAIYLTESSWRQFCTTNQTVIAFDCGYGIAQVTSGMRRGESSAFDPARVASSPAYNVSVGAAILADKWRAAACVGSNDPEIIEDWYFAVWGYNGFVYRNNPNNPMFAADRREFRTPGVASAQTRGNYPYQELVWGYAHYPLTAQHYTGMALGYPRRSEICSGCARPTATISEPGPHRGGCTPPPVIDAGVVHHDAGPPPHDSGPAPRDVPRDLGFDVGFDVGFDTGPTDLGSVTTDLGEDTGPTDTGTITTDRGDHHTDRPEVTPRDASIATDNGEDPDGALAEPSELQGGCACSVGTSPSPVHSPLLSLRALAVLSLAVSLKRSVSPRAKALRRPI